MQNDTVSTAKRKDRPLLRRLSKALYAIIGCIALMLMLLYFYQEKLIFFPQTISQERLGYIKNLHDVEELSLKTRDGITLNGWLVKNGKAGPSPLVIYFGGNGDELSDMIDPVKRLGDCSVALINYRGYGLSEGRPSEKDLCSDALEIYDHLLARQDIDKSKIIVMGRSLGTGVATYVAYERNPAAVILVSPYDSLESLASEKYPVLPVHALLKHKFDSLSRAPFIKKPVLMLIAANDRTISPPHSRKLAEKWGGDVTAKEIKNVGHSSIYRSSELWENISQFLGLPLH